MEKGEELLSTRGYDRFTQVEITRNGYWNRSVEDWLPTHADAWHGADDDIHCSIGAWDFEDELKDREAPVFIPWYIIDLDNDNPDTSLYHARVITGHLRNLNIEGLTISYSGNRGFHIAIPSGAFNNPVYRDTPVARRVVRYLLDDLTMGEDYDRGLVSPVHLCRMAGSLRENGRRKVPLTVHELYTDLPERLIRGKEGGPSFDFRDPRTVKMSPSALTALRVAVRKAHKYFSSRRQRATKAGTPRAFIRHLLGLRVEEGQQISPGVTGRNKAIYVAACGLFEAGWKYEDVIRTITRWNESRISPPVSDREIDLTVTSAERTFETN